MAGEGTGDEAVHGWFGFPVVAGDEVLGVVEFFSREVRQIDPELVQMTSRFGRLFGWLLGAAEEGSRPSASKGPAGVLPGRRGSWMRPPPPPRTRTNFCCASWWLEWHGSTRCWRASSDPTAPIRGPRDRRLGKSENRPPPPGADLGGR